MAENLPTQREKARKVGRPPMLPSEAILDEICRLVAEGESITDITKRPDMPSLTTVFKWLDQDAEFAKRYARAREFQGDLMDACILDAAKRVTNENAQAIRVEIDAYKWRAAKLAPKRYGDRIDVTSGGEKLEASDGLSLQQAAKLAAILAEAEKRKEVGD